MNEDVTFKLPISNKEVTIKGFASYKVTSTIQRIINDGMKTTVEAKSEKDMHGVVTLDKNAEMDANQRAIEMMVVSFDGSTDNLYDRITDLPEGDVDEVINQINKVTDKSKISDKQKKS